MKKNKKCAYTKKTRFNTRDRAEKFIADNNSGPGLFLLGNRLERSYYCEYCRGWHCTATTVAQYEKNKLRSVS